MNLTDTYPLVEEGEKLLHSVAKRTGLTENGEAFLIAALDPMHDTAISDLCGWPDGETGPSIVRCVKQSLSLKSPYIVGTGNWNLHIVGWPFLQATEGLICGQAGSILNATSFDPITAGGVTAHASLSDNYNWIGNLPASGILDTVGTLSLPGTYHKGFGRLIGYGIEVVDTTAELYKQGLVTVYRQAQGTPQRTSVLLNNLPTASGVINVIDVRPPPATSATAMLLPGTRQWEAKLGAYVVASFTGSENEAVLPQYEEIRFGYSDATPGVPDPTAPQRSVWISRPATTGNVYYNNVPRKVEQINTSGIIFTGLNEQSSLTLKWNCFYETFPGPDEPDVLVLARPPANYDMLALELLKRQILDMPVGCYSGMNPNGEWFWEIVNDLADFAPILAAALPEFSVPIGLAAKGVKAMAQKKAVKEKKREAKRLQPQPKPAASKPRPAQPQPQRKRKAKAKPK